MKPWLRTASDSDARTLVFHYADAAVVLEGRAVRELLPRLLPLLDGTRDVDTIVAAFEARLQPAVRAALALLAQRDLLTSGPPLLDVPADLAQTVTFLAATIPVERSLSDEAVRLRQLDVVAYGGGALLDEIERLVRRSGVERFARRPWPGADEAPAAGDLTIVAPDPAELPRLADFNRAALAHGVRWLQVLPYDGHFAAIGPYYVPGETCCHACYSMRRAANVGYGDEYALLQRAPAPYPAPAALAAIVAGYAALLALRHVMRDDVLLPGRFLALELAGEPHLETHVVYRVPRCPACSAARRDSGPAPWYESA